MKIRCMIGLHNWKRWITPHPDNKLPHGTQLRECWECGFIEYRLAEVPGSDV
jgi:hypothetical protein